MSIDKLKLPKRDVYPDIVASIVADGKIKEPISVYHGKVWDGVQRVAAAKQLGLTEIYVR